MDVKELINRRFPSFESELIEILSSNALIKEIDEGEILMRPGQYIKSTMLVLDGMIKLYREGQEGGEFFVYFIEPGNACALSMVCASQHKTSEVMARVQQKALIALIPIELMDDLMSKYKSWYYFVLETYRSRFEELLNVIDAIAFKSMDETLEFYLLNQTKTLNTKEINITHQEIAPIFVNNTKFNSSIWPANRPRYPFHANRR
jgi:CRP/FNR family transcriptional regulator